MPDAAKMRHAKSPRSTIRPNVITVATKAATPLPTSDQLNGKIGQSIFSERSAPVLLCRIFHATKPRNVVRAEIRNR
jgi:hypothetical protein